MSDFNRSLTQLYPNIWRLVADNPSPMTGPGTNTYLVGQKQVAIIDPGPDQPEHLKNIVAALEQLDLAPQAVIVTHPHPDHDGCAPTLAAHLGVPLLRWDDPLQPDSLIELDCGTVQTYHTPGHIHAHVSLYWPARRLLFGADLVAGQGTILVIPPDGDMAAYLDSLAAMKQLDLKAILPGHGPVIEQPYAWLQQYIDHRLRREQQVLNCWAKGLTSPESIVAYVYADQPPEVQRIAALQVAAHLTKLEREGRLL